MRVKRNGEAFPWVNAICWQLSAYLSLICGNELLLTNILWQCRIVVKEIMGICYQKYFSDKVANSISRCNFNSKEIPVWR